MTYDRDFWKSRCHMSGEEIARQLGGDGGNWRAKIRKAKLAHPDLDWREDPRHEKDDKESRARIIGTVRYVPRIKPAKPKQVRTELVAVLPDIHGHDVDEAAFGVALGWLANNPVTKVIVSGDGIDLECLSKYKKKPSVKQQLAYEYECGNLIRAAIDDAVSPDCEKEWQEGNHERRLVDYLLRNAEEMYGDPDVTLEAKLHLAENGWTYTPTNSGKSTYSYVGEVAVGHFDKAVFEPGYSAAALMRNRAESVLQSHTHKIGGAERRLPNGRHIIGYEIGCLCRLDPSYTTDPMWAHGFGVLRKVEGSKRYQFTQMRIVGGELLDGDTRYA